jgi:hypothetical protein
MDRNAGRLGLDRQCMIPHHGGTIEEGGRRHKAEALEAVFLAALIEASVGPLAATMITCMHENAVHVGACRNGLSIGRVWTRQGVGSRQGRRQKGEYQRGHDSRSQSFANVRHQSHLKSPRFNSSASGSFPV